MLGRFRRSAGVLALATMTLAGAAWAQVLNQVPDSAMLVIKVKNVADANKKAGKFLEDIGVAALQPQVADPVGTFKQEMGLSQGLKEDGEFAFVLLDPTTHRGEPMLLLIPVSDYDAFLKNFENVQTNGAVSQGNFPNQNGDAFIAHWGDYAAVAPKQEIVATAPTATIKVAGVVAKELDEADISLFANLPLMAKTAGPELDKAPAELMREFKRNAAGNPELAKFEPVVEVAATQFVGLAKGFLDNGEGATLALRFGENGLKFTQVTQFTDGSTAAKTLGALGSANGTLLEGLPEASFLFYGGINFNGASLTQSLRDFADPIAAELKKIDDPKVKSGLEIYDGILELSGATTGETFGMLAPTAQLGAGSLVQVAAVIRGNADQILAAQTKATKAQIEFMDLISAITNSPTKATFAEGDKTVAGVTFNTLNQTVDPAAQTPEAMQLQQMFAIMYGPQGAANHVGKVTDSAVLSVMGLSDEDIAKVIGSVKANSDTIGVAAPVQAVSKELPANRAGVIYIALDTIINTTSNYMAQSGIPFKLQLPPDLQPVGISLGAEGSALKTDVYVPTETIQSIVAGALQAQQQMMGGGPAPRGGGF